MRWGKAKAESVHRFSHQRVVGGLDEDISVYSESECIWSPVVDQNLGSCFAVIQNDWNDHYSTEISRWHPQHL